MNMKRQRGRNGGGKPHMQGRSQTFDSTGPDVRVRGNAYQVLEKYLALARDATAAGDRVAAENFYQHAEHYYRVINASHEGGQRPSGQQHPQHQHQHHQQHQRPYDQRTAPHEPQPADDLAAPGAGPQPHIGPAGGRSTPDGRTT